MNHNKLAALQSYTYWTNSLEFWMSPERYYDDTINPHNSICQAVSQILRAASDLGINPAPNTPPYPTDPYDAIDARVPIISGYIPTRTGHNYTERSK